MRKFILVVEFVKYGALDTSISKERLRDIVSYSLDHHLWSYPSRIYELLNT